MAIAQPYPLTASGLNYTSVQMQNIHKGFFSSSDGVLTGCAVTGTSSPLSVSTGYLFMNGYLFQVTATETVSVGTLPAALTGAILVARVNANNSGNGLYVIQNTSGNQNYPTPTQNSSTYELVLAQFKVDAAGNISSLVNAQPKVYFNTGVSSSMIDSGAVTAVKLGSGPALSNLGYTPANKAGELFLGPCEIPGIELRGTASYASILDMSVGAGIDYDVRIYPTSAGTVGGGTLNIHAAAIKLAGTYEFFHQNTNGLIVTGNMANSAITNAKLADGAVTTAKLADSSVSNAKIIDGAVTQTKLGANSVSYDKIQDGAIINSKLGGSAVTYDKIADGNVVTSKIADGNVTTAKLANLSVTDTKIGNHGIVFAARTGGHAQHWNITGGTTGVDTGKVRMYSGKVAWSSSAATGGVLSVAIPASTFLYAPMVLVQVSHPYQRISTYVNVLDANNFNIGWDSNSGSSYTTVEFYFLAIGQSAS